MSPQFLTILLDDSAVSFCSYQSSSTAHLIDIVDLQKGIDYAKQNGLYLQIVYPNYNLPEEYKTTISQIEHIAICPIQKVENNADIVVLTGNDSTNNIPILPNTIIVNISSTQIEKLFSIIERIYNKTQRINIILNDIENFSNIECDTYQQQLAKIRDLLFVTDSGVLNCQINVLTDLLLLGKMNNCSAGQDSITLAPNGELYICPAFYYHNKYNSCGHLENWEIKNKQLLYLNNAPICSICDVFHCKRCLYKNYTQTLEINTPSYEQCLLSHIEREQSRLLGLKMRKTGLSFRHIEEIDYMDPFEKTKS